MHILVAPNAFKNSIDAKSAARAICRGLELSRLEGSWEAFPLGDGGDGTASLLLHQTDWEEIKIEVSDPLGRKIQASFGLVAPGNTAVIELANASGLRLLSPSEYNPMEANTRGTGELMLAAIEKGVSRIILCLGGSATVDGGVGLLQALGIRFLDSSGIPLDRIPGNLGDLEDIDTCGLLPGTNNLKISVLCDVKNPLLGTGGAAAVFGPQKGAAPQDVSRLAAGLGRLRDITLEKTGIDISEIAHGGAAGGTAAGLHAFLGAELLNGIDFFLDHLFFDESLKRADLLITGEGRIDGQTMQGKGPFGAAIRARNAGIPVIGLAGSVPEILLAGGLGPFDVLLAIGNEPMNISEAQLKTEANLERISLALGDLLQMGNLFAKA